MNKIISEQININSSAITSLVYCCDKKELYVSFISGIEYCYTNVPHEKYISLKYSDSIGKYFNKFIKNEYDHKKVDYAI